MYVNRLTAVIIEDYLFVNGLLATGGGLDRRAVGVSVTLVETRRGTRAYIRRVEKWTRA